MPRNAALAPAARIASVVGSTWGAPMKVAIPDTRTECHPWRVCCDAIEDMPAPFELLGRDLGEHLVDRDAALLGREPGDQVDRGGHRDDADHHHDPQRVTPAVVALDRVDPEPVLAED